MGKKPAVVSGGLGGLGEGKHRFVFIEENFHPLESHHRFRRRGAPVAGNCVRELPDLEFDFFLGGLHWLVRLVDGANLPRRMISARLFS